MVMDVQDRLDDCVSLEPVYNTANESEYHTQIQFVFIYDHTLIHTPIYIL